MPLYIPWLTETIKKRGVRYLLHHYLGQFFLEKLTLEQLSIDIYEGKGSIKNLALDVDGLNDELDFIPFKFLDGCLIGEISVEVPWSSLATDACRVELNGAKFVCRLKTSTDSNRSASNHNNSSNFESSTLISRSLMTSSMQMAEDIVTREDSDDYDYHSPSSSLYTSVLNKSRSDDHQAQATGSRKDAGQMFEGLEMFAQLIDSVLRRTKLTARNTLFQIQPHPTATSSDDSDNQDSDDESTTDNRNVENSDEEEDEQTPLCNKLSSESGDEFLEPLAKSDCGNSSEDGQAIDLSSDGTVEFFIKFFRCEEIMSESNENNSSSSGNHDDEDADNNVGSRKRIGTSKMPETVTKLLTLEDVEMRIGGIPVSNLIGKHTIMIKFNGHKSEISIFSSSPLLAVINHEQLKTFFNVFDNKNLQFNVDDLESQEEKSQKLMSTEDYAKIENQLLETARTTMTSAGILQHHHHGIGDLANGYIGGSISNRLSSAYVSGKRWTDGNDLDDNDYHLPNQSVDMRENSEMRRQSFSKLDGENSTETTLNDIEAFSCELKLPGIWLCILRDGEHLPPLIKPYADSINSFDTINNYIEKHIKVPHIRFLALKVSLDITFAGINIFLGDLNISEHLYDKNSMNPTLKLFNNDSNNSTMNSARYTASIINNKDITVELLTKTRILIDPTLIDRIVYDYKLLNLAKTKSKSSEGNLDGKEANKSSDTSCKKRNNQLNLNLTIKGEEFLIELLCPIPDLTPNAYLKKTQLRPQSFLFDFKNITLTWQLDKLNLNAEQLMAFVKTQPQQSDQEAIKFIESLPNCGGGKNDLISLIIEPSPSNLDGAFTSDVDQALNECSMYDSIYVGHASESKLPKEAFQTKRKVVRASFQQQSNSDDHFGGNKTNDCDNEKIISPGDRQHLTDYLNQTVMSTKLSLNLYMPNCQVEFEDKEQLDLIYNRFGNDFVFWQPRVFSAHDKRVKSRGMRKSLRVGQKKKPLAKHFGRVSLDEEELSDDEDGDNEFLEENLKPEEDAFHSLNIDETSDFEFYDNEVTCKITIDDFSVRFNHQSCASALKQEILAENVLLGVVIDINKKPCTILSMVADNLELSTDSDIVVEGNSFGDKNSIFSMTADIKRPTKALKDIKLAIQLVNGLLNDFNTETFTRFWQSINVTDEPIEGYVAPTIVTELHIDILNTALSLVRDGARPALLTIDEIYLTSMVVQQTSQVMIRLIADEVSLYLKKNRQSLEVMKNYVCLIDSGLIDLKVKFSHDGRVEFNVMNNVITVRACQDSLSSLIKLISVLIKNSKATTETNTAGQGANFGDEMNDAKSFPTTSSRTGSYETKSSSASSQFEDEDDEIRGNCDADENNQDDDDDSIGEQSFRTSQSRKNSAATGSCDSREKRLLEDAMNDYDDQQQSPLQGKRNKSAPSERRTNNESDYGSESHPTMQTTSTTTANNYSKQKQRDPNACLLDESNPKLDDLFPSPLLPTSDDNTTLNDSPDNDYDENSFDSNSNSNKALDESGFFVIGNDDVGAGIIDKAQHEPIIRKLIDEPINIIDNYFKMTKPRTIPEMLASSLERYVLEEMTLIVNLFGGRDLDDNDEEFNEESESSKRTSLNVDDAHGGEPDMNSIENLTIRSRTNSGSVGLAGARPQNSSLNRKHFVSESAGGNFIMKNKINTTTASRSERNRRKHLSEGSYNTTGPGAGATSMEPRVRFGEGSVNLWESLDLMSSPDFLGTSSGRKADTKSQMNSDIKLAGGTWRQNDVCIQLTLTKVKLLYELGDELNSPISWRFMLFIDDIEIKDRIHASDINKMLYEYCTESMPKRNIQMLTVKNIATINPSDGCEECDLRVSLKPLRFNIDQDTLLFLIEFFTCLSKSLSKQQQFNGLTKNADTKLGAGSARVIRQEHPAQADGGGAGSASRRQQRGLSETSNSSSGRSQRGSSFSSSTSAASSSSSANQQHKQQHQAVFERQKVAPVARVESSSSSGHYSTTTTTTSPSAQEKTDETLPTHCHHSIEGEHNSGLPPGSQQPIYIKSFTFSPDVPIRLDYHAKHLDFEQGALAGILMGLAHLDHSELILRRVQAKHGMRGLDRVLLFTLNSWITDIKRNQLPSILSGVGPMHSVIQLFQGMKDLIWMPIDHYRKDKRLVRGLQRGASSFSSSTAMAAINLMNRFISIVQCTAQIAHDIVTPPNVHSTTNHHRARLLLTSSDVASSSSAHSSYKSHSSGAGTSVGSRGLDLNKEGSRGRHAIGVVGSSTGPTSTISALNQPRNFCEGVAVGFTILKEGFKDTGRNVAVGMQAEDVRSAVGELVRQIPSTLLNPIISATEGAQNVLVGIRNQIAPDARREDQEKWKRRVRGK